jgi:hypothetical protein
MKPAPPNTSIGILLSFHKLGHLPEHCPPGCLEL